MKFSIIICSRTRCISDELRNNISETFHTPFGSSDDGKEMHEYELIEIDNSANGYSICEAYNIGVSRSSGDILCFAHDDIIFKSKGWANSIYSIVQNNSKVGVIGVIGTQLLTKSPSAWWWPELCIGRVNLGAMHDKQYVTSRWEPNFNLFSSRSYIEAVSLDGLFLCIPRTNFPALWWDEHLPRFQGYDTDICLQALNYGLSVLISSNILIEHKSPGRINADFYDSIDYLWVKHSKMFPIYKGIELSTSEIEARTRLVEEKRENIRLKKSLEIQIGKAIIHPNKAFHYFAKILSPWKKS